MRSLRPFMTTRCFLFLFLARHRALALHRGCALPPSLGLLPDGSPGLGCTHDHVTSRVCIPRPSDDDDLTQLSIAAARACISWHSHSAQHQSTTPRLPCYSSPRTPSNAPASQARVLPPSSVCTHASRPPHPAFAKIQTRAPFPTLSLPSLAPSRSSHRRSLDASSLRASQPQPLRRVRGPRTRQNTSPARTQPAVRPPVHPSTENHLSFVHFAAISIHSPSPIPRWPRSPSSAPGPRPSPRSPDATQTQRARYHSHLLSPSSSLPSPSCMAKTK